jgi:hypothetical protein
MLRASKARSCEAVYLHPADKYSRLTRLTVRGTKRCSLGGYHGLPAAFSPLVMPSTPAVRTHAARSGRLTMPLPTILLAHIPTGWGHGGTRKSSTSRSVQTWSVSPAAIAGVRGRHCVAAPLPWVGSGCGKSRRKLAWGKQKL